MLDAVRPLALQLRASGRQFRDALADFPAEAWEARLGEEATNHAAYVALHLLDARCFLLRSLDVDAFHGFETLTKDARRLEDISSYPGPEEILAAWDAVSGEVIPALEAITEKRLDGSSPHRFPIDDDTILGLLVFLTQHEAYHVGQLGLMRRAHGLSPLFPGPEG